MEHMNALFDSSNFMPHGHCYLWKPEIVWLHVISDSIIVLSYYAIPIILTYVIYKSKGTIPFNWVFMLFALFILACGTTHLMEIVNIWRAEYMLSGLIKAVTAIFSILTAASLIPILPKIIETISKTQEK